MKNHVQIALLIEGALRFRKVTVVADAPAT